MSIHCAEPRTLSGLDGQVVGPLLNGFPAAFKQVAAPVRGLEAVAIDVPQGELADITLGIGEFGRPVAEAGVEPVRHGVDLNPTSTVWGSHVR